MTATNAFETALLNLLLLNVDLPNVGDAAGLQNSAAPGDIYVSLHTSDPGEGGSQNTNEATYTGYARVAVPRSGAGWTVSGPNGSNAAAVNFGLCTAGGPNTITHFGIGFSASGAGTLYASGALGASLIVNNGITPSFAIGALDVDLD